MNKTLIATLATLLTMPALTAQDDDKPTTPPVKVAMKTFDKALDAIEDFLDKPDGTAPMEQFAVAQQALIESKKHTPRSAEQQPADKRDEFVRNYRMTINKTLRSVLDLEDAVLAQDYEAAKKVMSELKQQKKSGHRTYKGRRRRGRSGDDGDK